MPRALEVGELPPVAGFRNDAGRRRRAAWSTAATSMSGAATARSTVSWDGVAPRDAGRARHGQADERRGGRGAEGARAHARAPHRRRPRGGRARGAPRSASSACSPRCSPAGRRRDPAAAGRGPGRRDGRRRRQRRARRSPQADLGLAIGTGTDIAIEASDLTLVSGDLRAAVDAIRLARRTLATIKGNLFWAFAYNVAAIPLAVAGLLSPIVAAAAMACSSLFVVTQQPAPAPLPQRPGGAPVTDRASPATRTTSRRSSTGCTGSRARCAGSSGWSRTTATASTSSPRSPP